MNIFSTIQSDKVLMRAIETFGQPKGQSLIYGLTGSTKSFYIAGAFAAAPKTTVIIAANHQICEQYQQDLATLLPDVLVGYLPAADVVDFSTTAKSKELSLKRMNLLGRLAKGERIILLTTAEAGVQKVLPKKEFLKNCVSISSGQNIIIDEFLQDLVSIGYERVDQVESVGHFSVRGGIIDIFAVNREYPLRIELFGDEVDSLRDFDGNTQRSVAVVEHADIMSASQGDTANHGSQFLSYCTPETVVLFDEPTRIRESIVNLVKENPEFKGKIYNWAEMVDAASSYNVIYMSLMLQKIPYVEPTNMISLTAKGIGSYHHQTELFFSEVKSWQSKKFRIIIFMSTVEKGLAFARSLKQDGLNCQFDEKGVKPVAGGIVVAAGILSTGFELPQAKIVVLTERDILGRQKKKIRRAAKEQQITAFRDIKIGDYVVHVNHGIGKYVGVETLEVGGVHKDYLLIRYAGEDKLYVPTDQVHLLQKYIGSEGQAPRLNKMGGSDWLKAKNRAKSAVKDLAEELLKLYAEREISEGYAFSPDTPWQKEFEEAFPFEETPDQLRAVEEIKKDMELSKTMDRLLCGDVGFGKTEVAIRAAFKAIMDGKQVAVLVPTTVLAQQHYQTFSARFAGFGPVVDVISRFRSAKEQRVTIEKLASGSVDILIGTHRILQADVKFKNLGLLIVDEEQRFGVAQKEKLKQLRANVDVLTLTATPIPRTLHMSLVGVRDMSILESPPEDRFPVQTYVLEYNPIIIRDAIRRELKRGGQIYFVYNRVATIDKLYRQLSELVPEARIKVAHGQMPEEMLEAAMLDFYEGRYDVLLCTSIIENGLDVSNANTIIIYAADGFGLSQLYQMRGRVGRSHRMAYAYFTYRRDKVLTEVAEKRLHAIKEFAELGAGFKIAMRDLEIRGAGNLLGAQQHGHIVSVGFEMYCHLLEETVQELKEGRVVTIAVEPTLEFDVDAYLSGDYISDAMHKIEVYQRIAAIRSEEHIQELLDELIDRFGDPPASVVNLLKVARIKNMARELGIKSLLQQKTYVNIIFTDNPQIKLDNVIALQDTYPGKIAVIPGPPETLRLKSSKLNEPILNWIEKVLAILIK